MIIDYKVDSQILSRRSRNLIVADSVKYLTVRFDFSDDWLNLTKTVIFYCNNCFNEKYALLLHIDWAWSKYAIALLSCRRVKSLMWEHIMS